MKEIILAGGCFWGVEEYFSRINGVIDTKVGYANGITQNPSYEEVCTGETQHVEACYIQFDPIKLSLENLLDYYWAIVDPTLLNQQGHDVGTQYRTGIYFKDETDKALIINSKGKEQKKYDKPIVTEILPLDNFYDAESNHQKYLKKNPNGYCHIPL